MIRSRRLQSAVQQQPQTQTQQVLSFSTSNSDIQFVAMDSAILPPPGSGPPPLAYTCSLLEQSGVPMTFDGPFQVIEPGSELYVQTDPSFCFDSLEAGLMDETDLSCFSENGIPQDVLAEVFRMDGEQDASGKMFPLQYPVADGLSMTEYEAELVAEMEKLFPEATGVPAPASRSSRLMEELTRMGPSDNPCYMSVHLKGDGRGRGGRAVSKLDILPRDTERGFRCVDMVDGNGTMFKAKYYEHITIQRQPKPPPPLARALVTPPPYRGIAELINSPQLKNVSSAMASKIESLASGTRNVTLTPVRNTTTASARHNQSNAASTIVIKAPKRTIAMEEMALPTEGSFPMPIIKQEPPDEHPPKETELQQQLSVIDSTRIEVPVIAPTAATYTSKQPRKQKLQSLVSQCDVVFKETTNAKTISVGATAASESASGSGIVRKITPRPRVPPNDYVTVTIKDAIHTNLVKKQLHHPNPTRTIAHRPSTSSAPLTSRPSSQTFRFKKHALVTHYRIQTNPKHNLIPGQPVESIEILDSSDEENESSAETATAPESEAEDVPKPKLPGNTESIQCPFCCKIFLSPHALMLHGQNCADASMFQRAARKQHPPAKVVKEGVSLLKKSLDPLSVRKPKPESSGNPKKTSTEILKKVEETSSSKKDPPGTEADVKKAQPEVKKKRSSAGHKRSERLSIEILHSAFNIDNLLLCDVCKKTFRTQEHLDVHQKIHKAPTVCQYCKKKFYETPLKQHACQEMKRLMHSKRKSSDL